MICNTIGLTTDSFETLYVHGGAEVPEVYGSINYAQPIFYSLKTLTGATSYSFLGYPEPLKSYEIGGNMVQSGTPAPTSPIYPQECGDRTANLFDKSDIVTGYALNEYGEPTVNENFGYTNPIAVTPATYTFTNLTYSGVMWTLRVCGYKDGEFVRQLKFLIVQQTSTSTQFVVDDDIDSVKVSLGIVNRQNLSILMLNKGGIALPYEPYGYKIPVNLNGTIQNVYLDEPLRKIGDYADSISSDWTVTRRIVKLVLTGTESWGTAAIPNYTYVLSTTPYIDTTAVSSHFVQRRTLQTLTSGAFLLYNGNEIYIKYNYTTSVDDFKAFLAERYAAGTPVTVWYVLSTPTTEQVTVPAITPATGNNTFTIDTTLQPSSVSITGHVKPS